MTHQEYAEEIWREADDTFHGAYSHGGMGFAHMKAAEVIAAALDARYRDGMEALRAAAEKTDHEGWARETAARLLGPKPNAETRQALEDVATGKVTTYENVESFFKTIEEE